MDQAVTDKMKRTYQKQILRRLLLAGQDEDRVINFIMKDCVHMLTDAWETLTKENLKNGWNKLSPDKESNEENSVENENDGKGYIIF